MFHQQLCVKSGAVSLRLHHNIHHIIHKNGTLYLYRMKDSAKLKLDNPQICLLWKASSCLKSHRWLRRVLPNPENNLNVTFLHKETWRYRVLETSLCWEGKRDHHPNNAILTQKQKKKIHGAVQKLPHLVTEDINHTLLQNNRFSWFLFVQH